MSEFDTPDAKGYSEYKDSDLTDYHGVKVNRGWMLEKEMAEDVVIVLSHVDMESIRLLQSD